MKTLRDLVDYAVKQGLTLDTPIYGGAIVCGLDEGGEFCISITGINLTREKCASLLRHGADQCDDPSLSTEEYAGDAN